MDIIIPDIEHKYITLFETQQGYDAAAPNFIEVNWSAVKDTEHPEETPVPYQPSTRPTHGYEPVDNVDVFPDSDVRMLWYTYDHIYKTFFLEIIWGYSGWEWIDYEYTDPVTHETEILKGGNLYKVKEITEVPSIPDGYRLEHINNFINSQNKVSHVGWFDTSNLKSMINAFKNGDATVPFYLDCYEFPNVTNISGAFQNIRLKVINDETLTFNRVTNAGTAFNDMKIGYNNLPVPTIEIPNLSTAAGLLSNIDIYKDLSVFDVNDMFVGDTLLNLSSFSGLLQGATRSTYTPSTAFTVNIDLTDTNIAGTEIMDLSNFCYSFQNGSQVLTLNMDSNNPLNLDGVLRSTNGHRVLNLNGNESLVRSIVGGFAGCAWDSTHIFPYSQPINESVNDSWIFQGGVFGESITYDFSPNHTLKTSYGHFSGARINVNSVFYNMEYLNVIIFDPNQYITSLPNTLWDSNITYVNPGVMNTTYAGYTDFTRFKYIELGGSLQQIAAQTIYTSCATIFSSSMQLDSNIKLHVAQMGVSMMSSGSGGYNYQFNLAARCLTLNNNNMVETPEIYFHALKTDGNYYTDYDFINSGSMVISGNQLTDITIHIVNETSDSLPFLNLEFGGANLEEIIIDGGDYRCSKDWNIINCPNLNMVTFGATLLRRQVGHYSAYYSRPRFWCTQTQWTALGNIAGCQDHCRVLFSKITTDQEVDL